MGKTMFMRKGPVHTAPLGGLPVSSLMEGTIVMIEENGAAVPFYVAQHDYESSINGEGRTLFVRKDCYDVRMWREYIENEYALSDLDAWFNSTYKALLPEAVQEAMGTTNFYYIVGNGDQTRKKLARSVFALSLNELGLEAAAYSDIGSELPISSQLLVAYRNGSKCKQWTRSIYTYTGYACCVSTSGSSEVVSTDETAGSRPCFTLPADALVEAQQNEDGSVNLLI